MQDYWLSLMDFMARGGPVLWVIAAVATLMWTLALERVLYFFAAAPAVHSAMQARWSVRPDKSSWYARQIRQQLLGQFQLKIDTRLALVATLIVLCPMLGLLGTVTGMIDVFATLGSGGANNARNMAAGVSKATLPTMAGMVVALSGLLVKTLLDAKAKQLKNQLASALRLQTLGGAA